MTLPIPSPSVLNRKPNLYCPQNKNASCSDPN